MEFINEYDFDQIKQRQYSSDGKRIDSLPNKRNNNYNGRKHTVERGIRQIPMIFPSMVVRSSRNQHTEVIRRVWSIATTHQRVDRVCNGLKMIAAHINNIQREKQIGHERTRATTDSTLPITSTHCVRAVCSNRARESARTTWMNHN